MDAERPRPAPVSAKRRRAASTTGGVAIRQERTASMAARSQLLRAVPAFPTAMITRLCEGCRRVVSRHVLGLGPDLDTWPEPHNVGALPVPVGVDHTTDLGPAWSLDSEFMRAWHRRRTVIGAHAYRFERNAEYDCGWRLVDVAARFLSARQSDRQFDLIALVPPPPVYAPVSVLEWSGERLARRLNVCFQPTLLTANAPVGVHADMEKHLPLPLNELYQLADAESVRDKTVLLLDWRWHAGRSMKTIAKLLRQNGANAVCFTWLA